MLKMSKHHYLSLPEFSFHLPHQMKLAPVHEDADSLAQAIANDPIDHDDNWQLSERPDSGELESYWTHVEDDLRKDPEGLPSE